MFVYFRNLLKKIEDSKWFASINSSLLKKLIIITIGLTLASLLLSTLIYVILKVSYGTTTSRPDTRMTQMSTQHVKLLMNATTDYLPLATRRKKIPCNEYDPNDRGCRNADCNYEFLDDDLQYHRNCKCYEGYARDETGGCELSSFYDDSDNLENLKLSPQQKNQRQRLLDLLFRLNSKLKDDEINDDESTEDPF